jgi:Holliday junction DNA helicase RuvA
VISSVRGPVLSALGSVVVIEVGGIGFAVQVVPELALSLRIGEEARLVTTLIVREDSLTLFGFRSSEELAVFELLLGVTGVGPKSALGVLGSLTPDQIAAAVAADDDAPFRKVSGIGPKTAKLIVLSLTGKLRVTPPTAAKSGAVVDASAISERVVTALIGLGWPEKTAVQAVVDASADASATDLVAVPALLRLALARLGPAHSAGRTS